MTGEIIPFPQQGKKCKTCGFVMVPTEGEPEHDECHCCRHNIKLPLQFDPPENPCPVCKGARVVEVHVCDDLHKCGPGCPKLEPCIACGGTGRKA